MERYFSQCWVADVIGAKPKVRMTSAPPIYFQHNGKRSVSVESNERHANLLVIGHSFTVIGFEKLSDGASQLLAFDPALSDQQNIITYASKGVPKKMMSSLVEYCLHNYRKTPRYLRKHNVFEILT